MTSTPIFNLSRQPPKDLWGVLGIPPRGLGLFKVLKEGLPYRVFAELAGLLGLDKQALAKAMDIAPGTLQRRIKSGRFSENESDKLYRLVHVFSAAYQLFEGNKKEAQRWLTREATGLGGARPIDMIVTSAQTDAVLDLVGRIEHGVFT